MMDDFKSGELIGFVRRLSDFETFYIPTRYKKTICISDVFISKALLRR